MSTSLFNRIVFGPIHSRRLGVSLGVNLLPVENKYCNFNCIYCECGWTGHNSALSLPSREKVREALEKKLSEMQKAGTQPDSITFAGNGEPTIHPDFADIISDTVMLRNRTFPASKISVLSNATMLHRSEVVEALKKADMPILKLDSTFDATRAKINLPAAGMPVDKLIAQLKAFNGQAVIQTMFLQGTYRGETVNNTTAAELDAWEQAICEIKPRQVQIYTIDRDTPADTLNKVPEQELRAIAARIEKHGISVQIAF
ncbi:MAG: radical SAM protein [Bacteroidales bacterium]|jgi:wyosine [tRNA(Phe)-imidazoG37] synthetase (radical SAM superfamily)|nr:radical SAM protein [Bacteroidales bacterium]